MKNLKKLILVGLILGLVGAGYVWFFVYNKEHTDYTQIEASFQLNAEECFTSFVEGTEESKQMIGEVIQIQGTPQKLEKGDSLNTLIFVFNEGMFGDEGIRCVLSSEDSKTAESLSLPSLVSIKGYAIGYNETDFVMEQCTIVN